jgi:Xaa-Pro aminopeptidase
MAAEGVDAYFGVRAEHMRYLTGFRLDPGEDKVAGFSGQFLVSDSDVAVLADSRYTIQATRQVSVPGGRVVPVAYDLAAAWGPLVEGVGARRVAVEAAFVSQATWARLAGASEVELVPVEGWLERDRALKEAAEIERIAAACAVADAALEAMLPAIRPGVTERELAWRLEVAMRQPGSGAEALAFDVAALFAAEAALPHGSPGERAVGRGSVLLFDFGAQVAGYRSDMTRTLFVGEPSERDLAVYELVAEAQAAAIAFLEEVARGDRPVPTGREVDAIARGVIESDGRWPAYGHGLGHGIGLATHEAPSLGRSAAADVPLPSPTVFSVEPGIYLEGEMGVRIEDLVAFDAATGRVERLTQFPREVTVVGA